LVGVVSNPNEGMVQSVYYLSSK